MKLLHASIDLDAYRSDLLGDNLGWAILADPELSFRPVHRILNHLEDGPVVMLGSMVFEIDPATDDVFATDEEAMDSYYKEKK